MFWQMTGMEGQIGNLTARESLSPGLDAPVLLSDGNGHCPLLQSPAGEPESVMQALIEPFLTGKALHWVILPGSQRQNRLWWEGQLAYRAQIGFGRAAVALSLQQMNRLGEPGRLVAVHLPPSGEAGIEAVVALDWTPTQWGLAFSRQLVDGRTDLGGMIDRGRQVLTQPELLVCPGQGGQDLDPLLPYLGNLGDWVAESVRWEFPEAPLGRLGVAGSLYNWAWLETGYRLGDWQAPAVVLDMDDSSLAGLSIISWQGPSGSS